MFPVLNALWWSEFIDSSVNTGDVFDTAHLKNAIKTCRVDSCILDNISCWGFLFLPKCVCLLREVGSILKAHSPNLILFIPRDFGGWPKD